MRRKINQSQHRNHTNNRFNRKNIGIVIVNAFSAYKVKGKIKEIKQIHERY